LKQERKRPTPTENNGNEDLEDMIRNGMNDRTGWQKSQRMENQTPPPQVWTAFARLERKLNIDVKGEQDEVEDMVL